MKKHKEGALNNYKGEHYDSQREKYQDPVTGAHFRYKEVYDKLFVLQQKQTLKNKPPDFESHLQALNHTYLKKTLSNRFEKVKSSNIQSYLFKSQDSLTDKEPFNTTKNKLDPFTRSTNKPNIHSADKPSTAKHHEEVKIITIRPSLMYIEI